MRFSRASPPVAVELAARAQRSVAYCSHGAALGDDDLGRAQPRELGGEPPASVSTNFEPPGRNVRGRERDPARRLADRDAPVGGARVEQRFLGQRARGHHPDDRARDQRLRPAALLGLGGLSVCSAMATRCPALISRCEIADRGMHRHAAHRDLLAVMLAARGQRDVERRARDLRIVEEQFEEIAHAIE